jgi:tetratricopeptide (TPR) repeat protein
LYSKAIEYYDLSISIQERLGDKDDRSSNYHSKADALRAMGEYAKSLDAEKLAYFFAKETQGREQLAVAYQGLALSYEALGDHANAFVNMQLYANLRDSINREENRRNVTEMQTRFDSENKEKQIALQDQQLKVQDLEDQRKNTVINFTIIGLVLMFLLALLLYNRFRIKQKANKELESAYQVIEEKNKSITDSIHYAKRIQESLLPTEKYIDKSLEKGKRKDEPSGHV